MAPLSEMVAHWRPRLTRRGPWLWLLIALAVAYYSSYVRYGINFRDEGGTVALLSKRLLEGERPFLDLDLGYNVMWFYPVVGLFKLFGVNFVLLRAYCFTLSTLTAVLAFLTVERASRRPWLAFLVALLPVLVPGMTFKNYMPLLAVANSFCLLHFVLGPRPSLQSPDHSTTDVLAPEGSGPSLRWLVAGALVLGLTFLIRIDVGTFFLLLWLGALTLLSLRPGLPARARAGWLLGGPLALLALVLLVHLPVYLDAVHRGFAAKFVAPYAAWPSELYHSLQTRLGHAPAPALPAPAAAARQRKLPPAIEPAAVESGAPAAPTARAPTKDPTAHWTAGSTDGLRRKTVWDLGRVKDADEAVLILLVYLPLLTLLPLAFWAAVCAFRALWRQEAGAVERPLAALLVLGGALTTFPQYFFFRPDAPHVSEFSPGFWVAVFSACWLLGFPPRPQTRAGARTLVFILLAVLVLHAGLFLWRMMGDRFTGTIAARKGRTVFFQGANGVDVYLSRKESQGLRKIQELVRQYSPNSSDYLLAYPYHPALNLVCDRRAYEKNLYVDNATRGPDWNAGAIRRIQRFKPAVIVLSDWNINGSEASRFSVWAQPTKTWIQTNYTSQGSYLEFEVFTRPPVVPVPEPASSVPAATAP